MINFCEWRTKCRHCEEPKATKQSLYYIFLFIFCASLLSGCAFLPIQPTPSYLKDLYRRIQYTIEGHYRVIDIFYATSRQINEKKKSSIRFKHTLAREITVGTIDIRINPRLKIGKMLPDRLKRRGVIGIQDINKMAEDDFMKQLSDAVDASPHKSLLVMVFGYKDDFSATVTKAAYFSYLLDINTPILLFDWPGDQSVSISGYKKARSLAVASGPLLGELLARIIREVKPEKLWVKASSLGCQVVCDAFDHMHKYDELADSDLEIDHVIMAAPDVGQDEFDDKFKDELSAMAKKLTTYVSSDDEALLISGFINNDKRLGLQKPRKIESAQEEEAKGALYLKSMMPDKITIIDVTPINDASYKHGYYLECPEFFDDFYQRIFDKHPNVNRRLYLLKTDNNTDYWVMRK